MVAHNSAIFSILDIIFFLWSCQQVMPILGKLQMCDVETGQTNIILDIEESRGDLIGQSIVPNDLPIYGDPNTEITLDLIFPKGHTIFLLDGKKLKLIHPLDRDEENLSHIVFQVSCTIRYSNKKQKRNIPIIVRVSDVNDNAPRFVNTPYEVTVPEDTAIGTTIFRNIQALDKDAGVNGLVEYFIAEAGTNFTKDDKLTSVDGYGTFAISFPHQGQVTVTRTLDYEKIQRYYLTIVASDRARNNDERRTSTTTLIVNIADSDDLDPSFIYRGCALLDGACINPEYTASVPAGSLQGVLTVLPERIQAVDLDTISSPIRYMFGSGIPANYGDYFEIDETTGVLKQIKAVDTSMAKKYSILVRAEEISSIQRFTTAKLSIAVNPVDANPPVIISTEIQGYVFENSPIGTKVLDGNGKPIIFKISDADIAEHDPKPQYIYELTTPSFNVTYDGMLIVNEEGLDRDPPSLGSFNFQLVAREPHTNSASTPLTFTVYLLDVNDNAPKLSMIPPILIIAGNEEHAVTKLIARDIDEGVNAQITYSIYHVSNNGMQKFTINKNTGEIRTQGHLSIGEQYSLTVQATDMGGLFSQAIAEVIVTPGPNTRPPRFQKAVYEVQVSEGAEINSTVTLVRAEDPENDSVTYSIVSGNDLRQFAVGQESGVIMIIRKLDRESLTRYQLVVKANDNGGLSTSAIVNIKVTDINDKNPEFDELTLPYVFKVDEGKTNEFVGIVYATDADEGINAEITYFIPTDVPFSINGTTGEIRTAAKLDFENQNEYKFVVTAKDKAPDARLGTASVTIIVSDLPDEAPKFTELRVNARVPENKANFLIATVQAHDPDSVTEITYVIRKGEIDLFKINPTTGQVFTTKSLDYEKQQRHELIIGTIENDADGPGDTVRLFIEVEDRNDVQPEFITGPKSVTLSDDTVKIGAIIATLPAIDADGTAPGNIVHYELVGRGKALKYFLVDPDTAAIKIREKLSREEDAEYEVDIRAYDMGDPQLSSVTTLLVFVPQTIMQQHLNNGEIKDPEILELAFSDDTYTAGVSELTAINTTLKIIPINNSKKHLYEKFSYTCEFVRGNEQNIFKLNSTDYGCGIILTQPLDFENQTTFTLKLHLKSHMHFVSPRKGSATVKIIIHDENDNKPEFQFQRAHGRNDTFYAVVTSEMNIDTPILQIHATDRDSGIFGTVRYKIFDNTSIGSDILPSSYFTIKEDTGILSTAKLFRDEANFPMIFYVEARDNGNELFNSHISQARIVVNLLTELNRISLAFSDASPEELLVHHDALEILLEEKTHALISGIERFSNRKFLTDNGTIMENLKATDVWFYLIEPNSEKLLNRNDSFLQNILTSETRSDINFAAANITRSTAEGIYAPIEINRQLQHIKTAIAIDNEFFPITLIALSIIILIIGTMGILYICISWSKYTNFKQRMRQYSSGIPPRYDPVIVNSQDTNADGIVANLKEYETQMLAMAVPPDGDDDLHLDFSAKNHAFILDNVSYITHKENGSHSSPSHSNVTSSSIATLRRHNNLNNFSNNINNNNSITNSHPNTFNCTLEMNPRDNTNPLASPANRSLTLGRIKQQNSNFKHNSNIKWDLISSNNSHLCNTYSTMDRSYNTSKSLEAVRNTNKSTTSGIGQLANKQVCNHAFGSEIPINKAVFQRSNAELCHSHLSSTKENKSFSKKNYGQIGFSYLNDLDRSEVETTTEL